MKKYIIFCFLFCASIHAATFFDDFDRADALSTNSASALGGDWEYKSGNGSTVVLGISGNAMHIPSGTGVNTGFNIRVYSKTVKTLNGGDNESFKISGDIQTATASGNTLWYGLAFNIQDDGSCYMIRMCTSNATATITANYFRTSDQSVIAGTPAGSNTISGAGTLALSSVYHYEISSDTPGTINYTITGANLPGGSVDGTITFTTAILTNGYGGVYMNAGNSNIKFDNLRIETKEKGVKLMILSCLNPVTEVFRRR